MKKWSLFILLMLLCLPGFGLGQKVFAAEVIAGEEYNRDYNIWWQLTDDGVLTVSSVRGIWGVPEVARPWDQYRDQIKKIVIKSPVESIGDYVFNDLHNLEEVELPQSLQIIGEGAFSGCTSLKEVELPQSLQRIGKGAFSGCTSLKYVYIPDSVERIDAEAFAGCTSLERIHLPNNPKYTVLKSKTFLGCPFVELDIPDSVTMIEKDAFDNCSNLVGLRVGKGCQDNYCGAFNNADKLEWAEFYSQCGFTLTGKENLRRVVLGPNASKVRLQDCPALDTVILQEGLTALSIGAFQGCTALKTIQLPSTLVTINKQAFEGCTALTEIQLPSALKNINDRAFYDCPLETLELPHGLERIGSNAFWGTKLRELILPATLVALNDQSLSCDVLEKVVFLGNAPNISLKPMANAAPIVYYPAGNSTWTKEYMYRLCDSVVWESFCPNGEERAHAFSDWETVIQPTTEASGWAKRSCPLCGLVEERVIQRIVTQEPPVTRPIEPSNPSTPEPGQLNMIHWEYDAVTGTATASGWGTLTSEGFKEQFGDQPLRHLVIGEGILAVKGFERFNDLESVVFPDSLRVIASSAFGNCSKLQQVSIGAELSYIGAGTFGTCSNLQNMYVSRANSHYADIDGVLLTADEKILLSYPKGRTGEYTIPSYVTKIGEYAFTYHEGLTVIHIPGTVKSIGEQAFWGCRALTDVDMAEGVLEIGYQAFSNCVYLRGLTIPASVKDMSGAPTELQQLVFLGEKPESIVALGSAYGMVVYYPAGDSSWDAIKAEPVLRTTWKALCAGEHTFVTVPGKAATCEKQGLQDGIACSVCGLVIKFQESLPLADHIPVTIPEKAGTCQEKGLSEGAVCWECGLVLKEQEELPLGGHSFSQWKLVNPPTESEYGMEERACNICGEKEQRFVDKLQPKPTTWLIAVIAVVAVCFVAVEAYLLRKKRNRSAGN